MPNPATLIRSSEPRTATTDPLDDVAAMLHSEARQIIVPWLEARAIETRSHAGVELAIEGYAAVFDTPTIIDYGSVAFEEIVARGAFRKILATGTDVICQADHTGEPLGRISNGTLTITEDTQGVRYRCTMPDTQHGRDTWQLVQRGDYPGCSFTFYIADNGDTWDRTTPRAASVAPGVEWWGRRIIRELAQVIDVGPVTWPAYEATNVDAVVDAPDAVDEEEPRSEPVDPTAEQRTAAEREHLQRRARLAALTRRTR